MNSYDLILKVFDELYEQMKEENRTWDKCVWHNEPSVKAFRVLILLAITKNKPAALALKEAWQDLMPDERRSILAMFRSTECAAKMLTKTLTIIYEIIGRVRGRTK